MTPAVILSLILLPLAAVTAIAQTPPAPLAPPVSSPPAPNPPPGLSPILSNPSLARAPALRAPVQPAPGATPLDQQQMSAYRGSLQSQQRTLEQQGVSPGGETYRDVQQQLNQLNGGAR